MSKNTGEDETTNKLTNWKAPDPDQLKNFRIKHLISLHPILTKKFNSIINNPHKAPLWLNEDRTTLIHKKGDISKAKNYCPITCLPTYFKLITLLISDVIYQHLDTNNILLIKQKGIRRKSRGCKDHLLMPSWHTKIHLPH